MKMNFGDNPVDRSTPSIQDEQPRSTENIEGNRQSQDSDTPADPNTPIELTTGPFSLNDEIDSSHAPGEGESGCEAQGNILPETTLSEEQSQPQEEGIIQTSVIPAADGVELADGRIMDSATSSNHDAELSSEEFIPDASSQLEKDEKHDLLQIEGWITPVSSIGAPSTEDGTAESSADSLSETMAESDDKPAVTASPSEQDTNANITKPTPKPSRRVRRRRPRASERGWEEMGFGNDIETLDSTEETTEDTTETKTETKRAERLVDEEDPLNVVDESPSRKEWLRQKQEENQQNEWLDRIMSMVGHEEVKEHFLKTKARFQEASRWGNIDRFKFDLILHGNKGTGKARIAEIYAGFLHSIGYLSTDDFRVTEAQRIDTEQQGGSSIFFSNADTIDRDSEVAAILEQLKDSPQNVALILSYREFKKESASALISSSEARRRFPAVIRLSNYTEDELVRLLIRLIKKESLEVEGGLHDQNPILRALAQRVARTRKEEDFENIRTLKAELDQVLLRQATRVNDEWLEWARKHSPDEDNEAETNSKEEQERTQRIITRIDFFGPEPTDVRSKSAAWAELQKMVGLENVKSEINHLFNHATVNRQRMMEGKPPLPMNLNRVFLGPPGVGKTTVAALYAKIIVEIGLVSKDNIVMKSPSDLVGQYIGWSEKATKKALDEAQGGVLVIDDAHSLYTTNSCGKNSSDVFRRAVIDTLVAEVSGSGVEDRCVILVGYPDQMQDMLLNSNPGLQRRFPLEDSLRFDGYTEEQLCDMLFQTLTADGIPVSEQGRKTAREVLSKMRVRPGFGNGGDVMNLAGRAKLRQRERLEAKGISRWEMNGMEMEPEDFDPDYDRATRADEHRNSLFEGFVGFEKIVAQFQGYQHMADGMRQYDIDPRPHIPWAFIFKGPPGTGKTSTARKVGRLFYDMGLLSSPEVMTCSVTDLVGEYQGQTGPKVIGQFERGLGKVLFIDEAYRLAPTGGASSYFTEAVGELVDAMTKPRYIGNMVVILAGYTSDMENLLSANQGLRSRFPTHVTFPHMEPQHCLDHLEKTLAKLKITIDLELEGDSAQKQARILRLFKALSATSGWANGRDVESLAKTIIGTAFIKAGQAGRTNVGDPKLTISADEVMKPLEKMLRERRGQQEG